MGRFGEASPVLMKLLLLLHAVVAVALAGAATHNGLRGLRGLKEELTPSRLDALYPRAVFWLYLGAVVLGSFLYPTFRLEVREAYLDEALPLATGLFELKEHLVALGLGALVIQRTLATRPERTAAEDLLFHLGRVFVMFVVVYSGLVGLFLVSVRSV